jgi:hypothetical protein
VDFDAVATWEYAFEGQRYGYVARFERVNSRGELVKDTLPLTWCQDLEDSRGGQRWHWKQWAEPRPLYVPATLLAADPRDVPVVLVEGEKCAMAGHQLLPAEFDFVSWPGGCKAWAMANWQWLMGRTVYLWPDADSQRERLTKAERETGVDPASKPFLPKHCSPACGPWCRSAASWWPITGARCSSARARAGRACGRVGHRRRDRRRVGARPGARVHPPGRAFCCARRCRAREGGPRRRGRHFYPFICWRGRWGRAARVAQQAALFGQRGHQGCA